MSVHEKKTETKLIHSTEEGNLDSNTRAIHVPVYFSTTFHQKSIDHFGPYTFQREDFDQLEPYDDSKPTNPARQSLEEQIADLEGGERGFAFVSGMAAISSAFMLLSAGDHILISENIYRGTYLLITNVLEKFRIDYTSVDMTNLDETAKAIQPNTKVIYIETPSNPCLHITDLEGVIKIAKSNGCLSLVDNTFMTPLYQTPIKLGADVVLHRDARLLSGHQDIKAGLAVTKNQELGRDLAYIQCAYGSILGAQDSWHLTQGIKTLAVRLDRSSDSAQKIADFLHKHPFVEDVFYPGLSFHPGNPIHQRQTKGSGTMLSFRLSNKRMTEAFVESIQLPIFAPSHGAVESILSYPATMSHATMPKIERERRGITDSLLRLSVGLEHVTDLIQDIDQALQVAAKKTNVGVIHTP